MGKSVHKRSLHVHNCSLYIHILDKNEPQNELSRYIENNVVRLCTFMSYNYIPSCCTFIAPIVVRHDNLIKTALKKGIKPICNDGKSNFTFNISGGNVQIFPNVTHVVQNCYSDQFSTSELSEEEKALRLYINNVGILKQYASRLAQCTTASDIGKVVVDMRKDEQVRVDEYEAVKERFINVLIDLTPNVSSGKTVSNVRQRIIDAWDRKK